MQPDLARPVPCGDKPPGHRDIDGVGIVPDRIDRRSFLARGALGAAGVAAAGMGAGGLLARLQLVDSGAARDRSPAGPATASRAPRRRRAAALVFGVEAEEQGFDPATGRFDETGVLYARTVFDPLTIIAADGSVQPYLAQSVTPNADYTVWTITRPPERRLPRRHPCDAAAIAGSLEPLQGQPARCDLHRRSSQPSRPRARPP